MAFALARYDVWPTLVELQTRFEPAGGMRTSVRMTLERRIQQLEMLTRNGHANAPGRHAVPNQPNLVAVQDGIHQRLSSENARIGGGLE